MLKKSLLSASFLFLALSTAAASASTVGQISACYACTNFTTFDPGVNLSDGIGFSFSDTTATPITNAVFSIGIGDDNSFADSFNIGTIAANSTVFVVPGLSQDGGSEPNGNYFFYYQGSPRDTSDQGPSGNGVPFLFTGTYGSTTVSTGIFTPGATYGLSIDGIQQVNFLGGPNGNDPCNLCFGGVVATISTPRVVNPSTTPEPSSLVLLGTGGFGLITAVRRRFVRA